MQILKIKSIQQFGIFEQFRWNTTIPSFSDFNLIFGWNYSGKTTLSRVFRCLEKGALHKDFTDCRVEVEFSDGTTLNYSSLAGSLMIRVFNEDFIEENFKWGASNSNFGSLGIPGNSTISCDLKSRRA